MLEEASNSKRNKDFEEFEWSIKSNDSDFLKYLRDEERKESNKCLKEVFSDKDLASINSHKEPFVVLNVLMEFNIFKSN
jgi:hypothetical protein